jgi:hypothetical protein
MRSIRKNQRHSYSIWLTPDAGVDAFEETTHFLNGLERDQFNPVFVEDGLDFLARPKTERVSNDPRNYNLKLG